MADHLADFLEPLPFIAVLRGITPEEIPAVGTMLASHGFRIIEVPLNSPRPFESIRRLAADFGDRCLVGAGTVIDVADVARVQAAGGRVIVMPHADTAVIREAKRQRLLCLPGVATITEAFAALGAGADGLKMFPAEALSASVLKAWRAVLPKDALVFPVGGIRPDNLGSVLGCRRERLRHRLQPLCAGSERDRRRCRRIGLRGGVPRAARARLTKWLAIAGAADRIRGNAVQTATCLMEEGGMRVAPIVKAVQHLEAGEWKAAHLLVQKDASSLGCWAHGIVHLIEGDLDNAKYWYRRAHRPLPHGNTASAEIAALKASLPGSTQ